MKVLGQLITELANESGYSEKKIRHVYDSLIHWLKYLVNKTDATTISVPHIGNLHVKWDYVNKRSNTSKIYSKKREKIEEVIKFNIEHKKRYCRHRQLPNFKRLHYNKGCTLEEIEKIQNDRAK